jgi:hypothetical protein
MWLKNRVNWREKGTLDWESMALERCVTVMAPGYRTVESMTTLLYFVAGRITLPCN